MKRTFILLGACVSLVGLPDARGQSIGPATLNATGGTKTIGSNVCDWSIGEMAMVSTFYGTSTIVTQGLLQNEIMIKAGVANTNLTGRLQVFPNPASATVSLQYTAAQPGALSYRLMDMGGKVILSSSSMVSQGTATEQVNIASLAAATYMLEVSFKTDNNAAETTSYKIEKLK